MNLFPRESTIKCLPEVTQVLELSDRALRHTREDPTN